MDYRQGRQSENIISVQTPGTDMWYELAADNNDLAELDMRERMRKALMPDPVADNPERRHQAAMAAASRLSQPQPEGNRFAASLPQLISEASPDGPGWNTEVMAEEPTKKYQDRLEIFPKGGKADMNPWLLGLIAQGAGTNPEVFGPMLDQMNFPSPDTPEGMQLLTSMTQPSTGIGESLLPGSGGGDPNLGPAGPMIDPNAAMQAATQQAPIGGTAPITGGEQAQQSPAQALQGAQQRGQTAPQVKGPTAPEPKFSGGVSGAAQPNKLGVPATVTPAQALMAALLGPQGSGGAGGQLPVPVLGQMMRR